MNDVGSKKYRGYKVDPIKRAWELTHPKKPFPPQLEKGMMSSANRGDR